MSWLSEVEEEETNDAFTTTNVGTTQSGDSKAEEYWYTKRRCIRCYKIYTNADNEDPSQYCTYHPGKFITQASFSPIQGGALGWTCCKNSTKTNRGYVYDENAVGCKRIDKHEEDVKFSSIMHQFNFDSEASRKGQLESQLQQEQREREKKKPKSANIGERLPEHPDYVIHEVLPTDTMTSLSLKYHTKPQIIKRINGLFSDTIYTKYLYMPKG